ncbi:unnamed protein product [Clonostachys solani]|uniref:NACHT domain-containing protein n=1 Tax=Clonostachys solani TaxID=160281 RepID=A0A9N9W9S3_9HYPO|nr:unnamed protein product [Clonostachys solani]
MSGFEVLGLACTIFQTISFAHETLNICIALYHNQKTPDADIEEIARSMVVAAEKVTTICDKNNKNLNKDISQIASGCNNDTLGQEIARIARECTKIASRLKSEVEKITSLDASGNLLITLKVASMSFWKKPKLKKLNESLCSCREQMQALLITQIWATTKANNLTQDPGFRKLGSDVQVFIANLEKGYTKLEDLLNRQTASTQAHITGEFGIAKQDIKDHNESLLKTHEKDAATKAQNERLRKSFEFPAMNSRRNTILDPQDATFGRIFRSYTNTTNRKNSPKTQAIDLLLDQWCPHSRILSHYFWKIGSTMENNIQGLYCSLIHQLIDDNELIMTRILNEFSFAKKKTYVNDWSAPELDKILYYILRSTVDRGPVCIFIDGLDEYCGNGGQKDLAEKVKRFARHEEVKLCVSSRPEQRLLESFSTTPNLKLQELTRPDMESLIQKRLGKFEQRGQISSPTLNAVAKLLIEKAEGVFLWLQLTMQSVENGIENEDSDEFLITRLKDLPSDITDLYTDMWKRLNQDSKVYRESAALFFKFLIRFQELKNADAAADISLRLEDVSLFDIACWKDENLQERLLNVGYETSSEEIVGVCERVKKDIRIRCAGLLEVQPLDYSVEFEFDNVSRCVDFVHRTAHDFLVDTEAGQQILSYGKLSATETLTQITKGAFCKSRIKTRAEGLGKARDPMRVLECLSRFQSDENDWVNEASEWLAMAESFYNAGLLQERVLPRPSFLGHMVFFPDLYDAAMPLFQKAEASAATEVLRLWQWGGFFDFWEDLDDWDLGRRQALVKAVPQLMSCGPDLAAAQAYVEGRPERHLLTIVANRTTALWQLGQSSLRWELEWRTTTPGPSKTASPQALVAIMSSQTTLHQDQWGLAATVGIRPGGGLDHFTHIDEMVNLHDWEAGTISPFFMLNTSFLLKHVLDGLSTHCPDEMTAQLHKIRGQIPISVPCISFICIAGIFKQNNRWFRVIDQTPPPLQSITDLIFDPTISLCESNERLEQLRKSIIGLSYDPKVLEQVELEDVLRAPAEEGRLGPCRLEDAGLKWSEELEQVIEVGTERPESPLPGTAEDATARR